MVRSLFLYNEFLTITSLLNIQLEIVPVLYGSLGLEKVTNLDFYPDDIDILVPFTYLEEKWVMLHQAMEQLGYTLVNLNEHEFIKNEIKIGFAFIEDLLDFANVDYKSLEVFEDQGATYHLLTILDYLNVYKKSAQDGYRRTKNNKKDIFKVEILKRLVQDQNK
jgi:hypothetical protein